MGYLVPVRDRPGSYQIGRVVETSPPPSPPSFASLNSKVEKNEFNGCISRSGPCHSIRLVKLASKDSTPAKVHTKFSSKFIFYNNKSV